MKQSLIVSFVFLFIVACGQEEATQPVVEEPATVAEPAVDEVIEADDAVPSPGRRRSLSGPVLWTVGRLAP